VVNALEINVAAAIFHQDDQYLICQRAHDDSLPLLWEFPGGKLEDGETLEECIIRECKEELDVDIKVLGEFGKTSYSHAGNELVFTFFMTEIVGGKLAVNVHEQIKWVSVEELKDYIFCPADVEIVDKLVNRSSIADKINRL
jgi:8-oxo-dGTP diphosphatase